MDNEVSQNLNLVPGLNQNLPPEQKFFLRPKFIILILAGIFILAGLGIGGYYLLKNNNPTPVSSSTPWPSLPIEASTPLPSSASVGDYSFDADEFLWGTEAYMTMMESPNGQKEIDAINNTLKVKNIKVRLYASEKNPTNIVCLGPNCEKKYDLDAFAKIFKENNWSMRPMFSPAETGPEGPILTDGDIDNYVNYIDWFISRYKNDADIKYIELINAPHGFLGDNSKIAGKITLKQLLDMQNKVYDRVKSKYSDIMVGTHGFEYMFDVEPAQALSMVDKGRQLIEYFLDKNNGAKFDYWAFHGYAAYSSPVQIPTKNKYSGVSGILEIRKKLDANGWQDRFIVDTENVPSSGPMLSDEQDRIDAAKTLQELVIKRTLKYNNKFVLSGITPLKIIHRGDAGEMLWGSLEADSSISQTVKAVSLLWSKLNAYKHSSHISGEFGKMDEVWMEKFQSASGNKELYIFFRPLPAFETPDPSNDKILAPLLDKQALSYNLKLNQMPKSVALTDINGNVKSLTPSQAITLEAVNSVKYLEAEY